MESKADIGCDVRQESALARVRGRTRRSRNGQVAVVPPGVLDTNHHCRSVRVRLLGRAGRVLIGEVGFAGKQDGLVAECDPGGHVAVHCREVIADRLRERAACLLIDGASTGVPYEFEHTDEVLCPLSGVLQVIDAPLHLCQVISRISLDLDLRFRDDFLGAGGYRFGTRRAPRASAKAVVMDTAPRIGG